MNKLSSVSFKSLYIIKPENNGAKFLGLEFFDLTNKNSRVDPPFRKYIPILDGKDEKLYKQLAW